METEANFLNNNNDKNKEEEAKIKKENDKEKNILKLKLLKQKQKRKKIENREKKEKRLKILHENQKKKRENQKIFQKNTKKNEKNEEKNDSIDDENNQLSASLPLNEDENEEEVASLHNNTGVLVYGGERAKAKIEEKNEKIEEKNAKNEINLEKISEFLEKKRDEEIKFYGEDEENIKKISKKYQDIYNKYIEKNIFLIRFKYGSDFKSRLAPYIPTKKIRNDFFMGTIFRKRKALIQKEEEESEENEEEEEEAEKKEENKKENIKINNNNIEFVDDLLAFMEDKEPKKEEPKKIKLINFEYADDLEAFLAEKEKEEKEKPKKEEEPKEEPKKDKNDLKMSYCLQEVLRLSPRLANHSERFQNHLAMRYYLQWFINDIADKAVGKSEKEEEEGVEDWSIAYCLQELIENHPELAKKPKEFQYKVAIHQYITWHLYNLGDMAVEIAEEKKNLNKNSNK